MEISSLELLPEIKILKPKKFEDGRGFFSETYNKQRFSDTNIDIEFVQDNQSLSEDKFTLRGLHFQSNPYAQDKLVRVLKGSILDVAVDIRKGSSTYGKHIKYQLSAASFEQILVPKGFAHGILTLEKNTEILYKVSNFYSQENDHGIMWNDPILNIDWGIDSDQVILSEKDKNQPSFSDLEDFFI